MPTDATQELGSDYGPSFTAQVAMPDGVKLATDAYVPAAKGRRGSPAVLLRTPYGRTGEIDAIPELARLLDERGIAVVGQDVRGKFDSGGRREPFVHEIADGHGTVEWIARQSWSDGRVVVLGGSYTGFTAWAAAASRHPALRGAVTRMTTCHVPDEWLYRQGLFRLQMNGPWALFAWDQQELCLDEPDWGMRPLSAALQDSGAAGQLLHWLGNPPESPWWQRHGLGSASPLSLRVQVPVLHWGGWWDLLCRGQLREWTLLTEVARCPGQRLVMGATDHDLHPFVDAVAGIGGRMRGPVRRVPVPTELEPAMDFLVAVCRDRPPAASGVRWELTHDGWHEDASWPPPGRHPVKLYLADGRHAGYGPEGGALAHRPDSVPATVTWTHDPGRLVPSLESFVWGTLAHDYPDERDAQVHDDVMTFSSQPVQEPVNVVGAVRLQVLASATANHAHLTATLCDVQPDGRALRIVEGGCLVRNAVDLQQVDVDLGPTAYRLRPGHRLRLAIAASCFPRYLWYPGDGLDPWTAVAGTPSEHAIRLGDSSFVELSVLD